MTGRNLTRPKVAKVDRHRHVCPDVCHVDHSEEMLQKMNLGLHELSQPLTALLCLMDYGAGLENTDEVKQVMGWGMQASERLRTTLNAMQLTVQQELQRDKG